jgi:hypothetical protein
MTSQREGPGAADAGTRKAVLLRANTSENIHHSAIAQGPRRGSPADVPADGEARP